MKTIKAHFDGRVFVPEEPVDLPLGCAAEVRVPAADEALLPSCADSCAQKPAGDAAGQESHAGAGQQQPAAKAKRPLLELLEILGQFPPNPDWPEDAAAQHDHYLYGTPKRPNP